MNDKPKVQPDQSKHQFIQIMPKQGDHLWHVWINRRQELLRDEAKAKGEDPMATWEHSLYEFKDLIHWLQYGHERIASAFEKRLPTVHRQCSLSAPEPVPDNVLKCCIGEVVIACPILKSLRDEVERQCEWKLPGSNRPYANFSDADLYRLMSFTCAWHIYTTATGTPVGHHFAIDTSEGYMLDTTDRMFWGRLYANMAAGDPTTPEPEPLTPAGEGRHDG